MFRIICRIEDRQKTKRMKFNEIENASIENETERNDLEY